MKWISLFCLLCWSSMLWGHGKEKHEPKIIGESGKDNHSQNISSTKSKEIEIEPLQKDFEEKEILHAQTQKQSSRISLDEGLGRHQVLPMHLKDRLLQPFERGVESFVQVS